MQSQNIPQMAMKYLKCPSFAVDDYRQFISRIWATLDPLNLDSSLHSHIEAEVRSRRNEDSTELFHPADFVLRFLQAIRLAMSRESSGASVLSGIALTELENLQHRLVNLAGSDQSLVRESLHILQQDLDRFAQRVELQAMLASGSSFALRGTVPKPPPPHENRASISDGSKSKAHRASRDPVKDGFAVINAWLKHHFRSDGYWATPLTREEMEESTGIKRRTFHRRVNQLFGFEKEGQKGWRKYELLCGNANEFGQILDQLTGRTISDVRPSIRDGRRCDSCHDFSETLTEWQGSVLCQDCFSKAGEPD